MEEIKNCIYEFEPKRKKDNLVIACNKLRNNHDKEELLSFRTQFVYQGKIKRNIADIIKTGVQSLSIIMVIISIVVTISIQASGQINSGFYQISNKVVDEEKTEEVIQSQKDIMEITTKFFMDLINITINVGIVIWTGIVIALRIGKGVSKKASYYESLAAFIDKKDNI
ncbi:hypothetical protein [Clostridium gasigenes]|uniref:hypothetical protein n=1 Tax=Clostridium gasigenes TaxID=94869 RepID=UPI001C0ADC20|nr:hypothetical protein [Clostridium gasigenes]MBU3106634.1 hypothetical protein [Clostridium gasigenes]